MADAVVEILQDYLVQQIKHEAQVLSGLGDKVNLVQDKLESLNAFLKESQRKRDSLQVRVLINQIREVADNIEDAIDNYIVSVIQYKRRGIFGKFVHGISHKITLYEVNGEINRLLNKVTAIYEDQGNFDIAACDHGKTDESEAQTAEEVDRRRSYVVEDGVEGFDEHSKEVRNLLVEGSSSRDVVSIVGMAGLGKSTLARKVYRDPLVGKHFHCCAWQVVGKQYSTKEILLGILRSVKSVPEGVLKLKKKKHTGSQSDGQAAEAIIAMLERKLRRYLRDMRYLIVLDDVWHKKVWNKIKDAFPDDHIGSRILITSRQENEASAISNTRPYHLQRLSEHHGWELFSKKVFRGEEVFRGEDRLSPLNKGLKEQIVEVCKGLPLSIVVIAGILRTKERSEWKNVVGHLNSNITTDDALVNNIVRLSYNDLPLHLKPCFLHFGIYPEDFEIPVRQLIQLWVAEGFIILKPTDTRILEDVAEYYLEELIRRSLIQVEQRRTDGGVKTCRIHDLFRELCIFESQENQILKVSKGLSNDDDKSTRRLSLHCSPAFYLSKRACCHSSTRSLFCFDKGEYEVDFDYLEELKLLRVLDAGKVDFPSLITNKLSKLYHLRYLRAISESPIYQLPEYSIYDLLYLETLDLRGIEVISFSQGIWNLKHLRHLYINGEDTSLPDIPDKKSPPNLQTLSTILLDEQTVKQLENIPKLRKLGVSTLESKTSNPLELLRRLQHLSSLTTLKVFHCRGNLTTVNGFPPEITKVTLVGGNSELSEIVKALGSLPKLQYLKISEWKDTRKFAIRFKLESVDVESFRQLRVLKMKDVECKYWKVPQGAMPQLQSLVINRCEFSIDLPSAWFQITSLQEVQLLWCSKEMVNKFKNLGLNDKLTVYPAISENEEED